MWMGYPSVDKWMDITEMRYVIASRYNVILVSLSRQQSFTFFPLRSQPPPDSSMHHMICVGHVSLSFTAYGVVMVNQFISSGKKQWPTAYVGRMQQYLSLMTIKTTHVDLNEH
ncbi:hypothetical protein GmHk_17G049931 [Glycine max]|nr:hypothetical protein GmHk_17G049931 [Glycine max]